MRDGAGHTQIAHCDAVKGRSPAVISGAYRLGLPGGVRRTARKQAGYRVENST